jgi:hypothetical protein
MNITVLAPVDFKATKVEGTPDAMLASTCFLSGERGKRSQTRLGLLGMV